MLLPHHSGELFSASVHNSVSLDFRAKLEENRIFTDLDRSYDDFSSENLFFYFNFLRRKDKKPLMASRISDENFYFHLGSRKDPFWFQIGSKIVAKVPTRFQMFLSFSIASFKALQVCLQPFLSPAEPTETLLGSPRHTQPF